jgi:hypothetical protein
MELKLDNYFKRPAGLIAICFVKLVWGMSQMVLGLGALLLVWFFGRLLGGAWWERWFSFFDPSGLLEISFSFGWVVFLLGATDFAIALGVWFGSRKIRKMGIIFFSVVSIWTVWKLFLDFSFLKFLVLFFNLLTLWYFWKILPKYFRK